MGGPGGVAADPYRYCRVGGDGSCLVSGTHLDSVLVEPHGGAVIYGCDVGPLVLTQVARGGDEGGGSGSGFEPETQPGVGAAFDGAHHEVVVLLCDTPGGLREDATVTGPAVGEILGVEPSRDRHRVAGHVQGADIDIVV